MSSPASVEVCISNEGSVLVRSIAEPAPYSVLEGVPIGSAVMSMTPEEYISFLHDQGSQETIKLYKFYKELPSKININN